MKKIVNKYGGTKLLYIGYNNCSIVINLEEEKTTLEFPKSEEEMICIKCGTKFDKISQLNYLLKRVYEIKKLKLLQLEKLAKLTETIRDMVEEIDGDLKKAIKELDSCPLKRIRRYQTVIKGLELRKKIYADMLKKAIQEGRMIIKLLTYEEAEIWKDIYRIERTKVET